MTKRDVVSVAIKIIAVVCLVFAAMAVPPVFANIGFTRGGYGPDPGKVWFLISATLAPFWYLILAYVLMAWGDSFAARLVPEDSPIPPMGASRGEERVFGIAMRIIGIVCLARGVPDLIRLLVELPTRMAYQQGIGTERWIQFWPALAGAVVVIAIGVYLTIGAGHLIKAVFPEGEAATPGDAA
jgi:hypothetical protein